MLFNGSNDDSEPYIATNLNDLHKKFCTLTMVDTAVVAINNRERSARLNHSVPYRGALSGSDQASGDSDVLSAAITLVRNGSFKDLGIVAANPSSLRPVQSGHDVNAYTGMVLPDHQSLYHLWVIQPGSDLEQGKYPAIDVSKEKYCGVVKLGKSHLQSELVKLTRWDSLFTIP
jgi:hypothetical protein